MEDRRQAGDAQPANAAASTARERSLAVPKGVVSVEMLWVGRRQLTFAGEPRKLSDLGEVIQHTKSRRGPLGYMQGIRLKEDDTVFLCVECLMQAGSASIRFNDKGEIVAPKHDKSRGLESPFVFVSGGKTSNFVVHCRVHEYGRVPRPVASNKTRGAMDAYGHSSADEFEVSSVAYLSARYNLSFLLAASIVEDNRRTARPALRGSLSLETLRKKGRTTIMTTRNNVLGMIARLIKERSCGRVAATLDGWTDQHTKQKYEAFTVTYCDTREKCVKSWCIGVLPVDDGTARKNAAAAKACFDRLMEYGRAGEQRDGSSPPTKRPRQHLAPVHISNAVVAVTTDNATAAIATGNRLLDRKRRIPCSAHTLDLVFSDVANSKFWSNDDAASSYGKLIAACRKIASHFSRSRADWLGVCALVAEGGKIPVKPPVDVCTRWSSTAATIQGVANVVEQLHNWVEIQPDPVRGAEYGDAIRYVYEERSFLAQAAVLLHGIAEASSSLHAERRVTLSSLIPTLRGIYEMLHAAGTDVMVTRYLKEALCKSVLSRYGGCGSVSSVWLYTPNVCDEPHVADGKRQRNAQVRQLHEKCGGAHDAAFAAMALHPRAALSVLSGRPREFVAHRGALFLHHLDRCFTSEPDECVDPGPATFAAAEHRSMAAAAAAASIDPFAAAPAEASAEFAAPDVRTIEEWERTLKTVIKGYEDVYGAFFRETWYAEQVEKRATAASAGGGGGREPTIGDMKVADVPCLCEPPLQFWSKHRDHQSFTPAYEMAMAVLAIPSTEAASERVFKQTKAVRAPARCHLAPEVAEAQVVVGRAVQALDIHGGRDFMRSFRL